MQPPRKGRIASKRYRGVIQAKVQRIENNKHVMSAKSHYCFSSVKLVQELFVCYFEQGVLIDVDNMNKVKMNGTTAVSRYHQPNAYFHSGDVPQHEDHDFPKGSQALMELSNSLRFQVLCNHQRISSSKA